MSTTKDINDWVEHDGVVILDGGLATALEARGIDLSTALWSARILQDDPEAIYNVHLDYFKAGADVAITASYQASIPTLEQYLSISDAEARHIIKRSVELAKRARDEVCSKDRNRRLFVAGSVGPYGACLANGAEYTGDYSLPDEEMQAFHRGRIQALLEAGADLLACETMPSFSEIKSLLALLGREFVEAKCWVSCTLKDPAHLSDGTPIQEVADLIGNRKQVIAFGYNCIPEQMAAPALSHLQGLTEKALIIYPNSGEKWNAQEKTWYGEKPAEKDLSQSAKAWQQKGARFIGGCCRTNAEDIATIRAAL